MRLSEKLAAVEAVETANIVEAPLRSTRRSGPVRANRPKPVTTSKQRSDATDWAEAKRTVREMVLTELGQRAGNLTGEALAHEVRKLLDDIVKREEVAISPIERRNFVNEVIQDTLGYGPLEPLLSDATVTEIMCNAHDDVWVERGGRLERVDVAFADEGQYRWVIEKIAASVGRRIDEGSPMVDARLPDGSRVNAVIPPLAMHAPALTIRKFPSDPLRVQDLINLGTMNMDLALLLEGCVRGRLNMVLSGGTGTGKTTVLNVLSGFVPEDERIITIEDTAELQLQQPHVVSLESRPANMEGAGEISIRDLVRNALRMRPNRIIVGECRGAEALDMLQAMNTGHEGSLTTVHSNSPRDALRRLETMVRMAGHELPMRAIREQLQSAIDVIIQLERLPNGKRIISAVTEVQGLEGDTVLLQDVFAVRDGVLAPTGLRPRFLDRLRDENIEVPARIFRSEQIAAASSDSEQRGRFRRVPSTRDLAEPERAR
jgi:pilus assembly protein CpaF